MNNYRELVENLIFDLNNSKENNLEFISLTNQLEQKILNDSMEKINFFWYLKNILWIALFAYFAGIAVFMLMKDYAPTPPHIF